ncbi:MAG: PqqD family protein [Clostridia bacterium]|nr:PqqD family protein [Clostridia bacterium]
MKLKYEFEAVDMGNEIVLVPVGNSTKELGGVVKLNAAAQEIIDLLNTTPSEAAIVDALAAKYENSRDSLRSYVSSVLDTLRSNGLLED